MTQILQNTSPQAVYPSTRLQKAAQPAEKSTAANEDVAVMRDTAWRYGGFADEAGEILKPYLGEVGRRAGYGISGLYCLVDLVLTARQINEKGQHLKPWERRKKVAAELFDLSVFHTFATMLIPPLLIGKAVSWTQKHLSPEHPFHFQRTVSLLQQGAGKWLGEGEAERIVRKRLHKPIPVLVGIALIPLIAHPFDLLMEKIQDWTTRLLVGKHQLVKQQSPIIIQPNKDGKPKITQLPEHWQSVPRADYWAPKDSNGQPIPGYHTAAYHSSTHRHKHKKDQVLQPQPFRSVFGEWQ